MAIRAKKNPHDGSTLEDWLREEGIVDEVKAEADRRFAIAPGRDIGPSSPAVSARCTDDPLRLTHFELIDYLCRVARSLHSQYRQVPVLRTVQERLEP